ncbi:hypothetical protein [Nannocystis pusilla]|uniref:hypothetical protein n=1 Tax=Nannocystis pusilla TaxID=889268 RepID=UPI003B815920
MVTMGGLGGAVPTGSPGGLASGEELTLGRAAEEDVASAREPRVTPEEHPHVEARARQRSSRSHQARPSGKQKAGSMKETMAHTRARGSDGGGEAIVKGTPSIQGTTRLPLRTGYGP